MAATYESTPNSGGYYTSTATYWANGLIDQLTGPGLPTVTYAPDGEGRIDSVSGGSQTPLSSTVYNTAGEPFTLNFGTGDSDNYRHDPNSLRMTEYEYTVNGQNLIGDLTWNANGSLQQLQITDPFNSGDTQTCGYTYDDLDRIASANCGSAWNQTYSFDVFGNVKKIGTTTFDPNYNSINQIQGYGYDADGFIENTGSGTGTFAYTWDVDGHIVSVTPNGGNTVSVTYDALGRQVEANPSGEWEQFVYDPLGDKLALMNGQTLLRARVPLVAGAVGNYASGGFNTYWHTDWLGSVRFASTGTRTMFYDAGIAPYGEHYAAMGSTTGVFGEMITDTLLGLSDTPNREYDNSASGRWLSPDPAGLAAADLTNPQSLNRYAYVGNNPTTLIDPWGLSNINPLNCSNRPRAIVCGGDAFGSGVSGLDGGCSVDNIVANCNTIPGLLQSGAAYPTSQPNPTPGGSTITIYVNVPAGCVSTDAGETESCDSSSQEPFTISVPGGFNIGSSFSETVQGFKNAGFVQNPQDYVDLYHPGQLDLRDTSPFCSVHVAIDKDSGEGPTLGDTHFDTMNPWAEPAFPSVPGYTPGGLLQAGGHFFLDMLHIYPGSQACQ